MRIVLHFVARRRLTTLKRTATMSGVVCLKVKPDQFALLNCTQPGRGKSQAIEHNSALPKVGQSLRRLRLVCLPLARPAGSGNGLLCLAPQPGQRLFQFASLRLFIRALCASWW